MDTWLWIVIVVAAVVIVFLALGMWLGRRHRRALRDRFGPEYQRTVDRAGSRRKGEHDLRERESAHEPLEIRPLSDESRIGYEQQWERLQSGFVDRPQVTVAAADEMLTAVMRERGYPLDDFESRSRLVSVDHPDVVEHYRRGHTVYLKAVEGTATTEELRQAVVSYRALFEDLVHEEASRG
jgi:hypothetical protein